MLNYILRRLLLLPLTLFIIIIVNFAIINLAPGDPVTVTEISKEGTATMKADKALAFGSDERYLHFREHYGLTLPLFFNTWPWTSGSQVRHWLNELIENKPSTQNKNALSIKAYDKLRIHMGDRARFMMPELLSIITDQTASLPLRVMAMHFFQRGAAREPFLGGNLSPKEQQYNRQITENENQLSTLTFKTEDPPKEVEDQVKKIAAWYNTHTAFYHFAPSTKEKIGLFFLETRFFRYMSRVLSLDFGTLRNDPNKTVIGEVTKRFKYSLTLALLPMFATFFLCQFFAFIMALNQKQWPDNLLNLLFLVLYALPIFVVAPFLIEYVGMRYTFPFSHTPIPTSGFTSPDAIYQQLTSWQRLEDIAKHLFLPFIAIMYGSLAAETRLSRTAILEVLRQDYVRTAWAKGAALPAILIKHVGRNAAITIVTSLAGSLGVILGGSLIVETLFEINGFGKFFYEAVLNRDYNVIMFSAFAGSLLSLLGYLAADIAYTLLDPRVTLD